MPSAPRKQSDTPAMRQYRRFKEQHPGCVLFFRMGDFYEMFFEDAELAHKVMGVTLTQRSKGVPMAGVPYHAVEGYLRRMIQAGHRVAVCDQVQDAKEAKGVVERDVTRVITPGTLTDDTLLDEATPAALAAIVFHSESEASLAWAELSTGSFTLTTLPAGDVADELARVNPTELLYCETADGEAPQRVKDLHASCPLTPRPAWQFRLGEAVAALKKQYRVAELAGFGFSHDDPGLCAAGAVLAYLLETQRTTDTGRLAHLRPPRRFQRDAHLLIDQSSLASLEVERTLRRHDAAGSLLGVLGGNGRACVTAMGKRRLRDWLCYPLSDRAAIEQRQRVVEAMVHDSRFADELEKAFENVQDIPRITARLSVGRATPRDLVALGRSADAVTAVAEVLDQRPTVKPLHDRVAAVAKPLHTLAQRITGACVDEPPNHLREGGLIRDGHDAALDESRALMADSNAWLAEYQQSLAEQTGIASLKVSFNKVFGYYIEVTAAHRAKLDAPENTALFQGWTRKQTLKNAERFITAELKDYEGKVLSAQDRAVAREQQLFAGLCADSEQQLDALHAFAEAVADLDVLRCFARRAVRHRYVKPALCDDPVLDIAGGRHPVLDELLGDQFVPNDTVLGIRGQGPGTGKKNNDGPARPTPPHPCTLALITGPNMAGKSTFIRQAALIALLAHTGSFVPADAATVGLCDRIFTRVGAHDELHAGRSTFMVEMTETANICHHATRRSLVILDEIGRGTSTLDGLSLAWAITEHLAALGTRTLFATHYHELTALADRFTNITNLNVKVREWNDQIVFLHHIEPGATDRSYGIAVAKLAGLPTPVVNRAHELLQQLAVNHAPPEVTPRVTSPPAPGSDSANTRPPSADASPTSEITHPKSQIAPPQLPLFAQTRDHPTLAELRNLDLNTLSPIQAFDLLRRLVDEAGET